jgi:hypothetical protein
MATVGEESARHGWLALPAELAGVSIVRALTADSDGLQTHTGPRCREGAGLERIVKRASPAGRAP